VRRLTAIAALAFLALPALAEGIAPADRKSGYDTMGPDTQGMQRDDTANPAMLWVREGEKLWTESAGGAGRSCASCHGDATSMTNVAARYPVFDAALNQPLDLAGRIQQCRTDRQGAAPLPRESRPLLALTSFVGLQSRGAPLTPSDDARLAPFTQDGRRLFSQRLGQLNLSCAACHDDNWGKRLGGSTIPQGHANGYPLYRLEWQGVGSLQRRLRNCLTGVRAEPFPYGDPALVNLELYLKERGAGLAVETPAVRP
jgi:L-cysteine S-thiosulfotransferase